MSTPKSAGSSGGGGGGGALPAGQAAAVDHLKAALSDASSEPGATLHYSADGSAAPPQVDAGNIGTRAAGLEGRDFIVALSADGRRVDVVERIDLPGPEAIRTDVKTGFGGRIGPSK
ncbi:MAG: hypothetical protein J3K34DRAFT_518383 [Monoraphidium minutum]|nr:MAG: hypothetical protein J3K34DRAFT_518383 [Monoraphidium minutum]